MLPSRHRPPPVGGGRNAGVTVERDAATLPNGSLFEDRYEILDELGSGSSGCVYRARQLSTGQSVAIKLLSPREGTESPTDREVERFRRETQICAALHHIHIVRLIDSGETKDAQLYAVFEHVPGETLAQALAREGALDVRESVRLMTQVLDALAAAHAKGIVHRDLKPANLIFARGRSPRAVSRRRTKSKGMGRAIRGGMAVGSQPLALANPSFSPRTWSGSGVTPGFAARGV